MTPPIRALLCATACAVAAPVLAAEEPAAPAAGFDLFASTDADDTEVAKASVYFDWRHAGPERYQGVRLETARFKPLGGDTVEDQRVYLRLADRGRNWAWSGQVGTDGDTVLGAFAIHNEARFRQEYFVEREIVETPRGLNEGIYYTFAGGAFDLPVSDRHGFTVVAGVQDFTGDNIRSHLRVNYTYGIKPSWGLSAQVRTRFFHSSEPGEYDYFSPEWYAEVMPVIQLRRFDRGWRYAAAVGVGAQRDSGSDWRAARYINAQVTSPPVAAGWSLRADYTYSNTPVSTGYTYDYNQFTLGVVRRF